MTSAKLWFALRFSEKMLKILFENCSDSFPGKEHFMNDSIGEKNQL